MKVIFGKYCGKDITEIIKDKNYKSWLLKQSFVKEKYPDIYNALINYKAPINFLQECENNLCDDILEKIGSYFKLPDNNSNTYQEALNNKKYENCHNRLLYNDMDYLSFSWRNFNDYDLNHDDRYIPELTKEKNSIIRVFKHRRNIYKALMVDNEKNKSLLQANNNQDFIQYWKYSKSYHGYSKFLKITINAYDGNKITYCCNAEDIFSYLQNNHYHNLKQEVKFMNDWKIKVGKYKDIFSYSDVYSFMKEGHSYSSENYKVKQEPFNAGGMKIIYNDLDGNEIIAKRYSVIKYFEWFKENIVKPDDPQFHFNIWYKVKEDAHNNQYQSKRFYD